MQRSKFTSSLLLLLLLLSLLLFTSSLRNAMFTFLLANNFIEHKIQKGFTPRISGTFEHTDDSEADCMRL